MKISLDEFKKAVKWIEVNSNDPIIDLSMFEANKLGMFETNRIKISLTDKSGSSVQIILYEDPQMMTKIKKTENL